ncbi:hypothetical protein XCR1_3380001 [Xenorhabdus cabanillasii JM26]|uniref:Uncharacterized protein n=1 Tax=Xenorhabdus cabanillasii JM26 TaxID=1427517 RepID=W1J8V9_9GAMM|nr:hypothetical protein XCR1_3380001 [Xenorhabdus cabanillasii JM26]
MEKGCKAEIMKNKFKWLMVIQCDDILSFFVMKYHQYYNFLYLVHEIKDLVVFSEMRSQRK